jgi:hypothetical protein
MGSSGLALYHGFWPLPAVASWVVVDATGFFLAVLVGWAAGLTGVAATIGGGMVPVF